MPTCITPITLLKKVRTSKNITNVVPCGTCIECRKRKVHHWAFRLYHEMQVSTSAIFLTLTYEEEPLSFNGLPTLDKTHLQKFWKKLRKRLNPTKIKYYAVGEYGSKSGRPHYHAILFNLPLEWTTNPNYLENIWSHGSIHIGKVEMGSIIYTLKYVQKGQTVPAHELDDRQKERSFMSKGLGLSYLTKNSVEYHVDNLEGTARTRDGYVISLPRYYKDKIFNESEKEKLSQKAKDYHKAKEDNNWLNADSIIEYLKSIEPKRKQDLERKKAKIRTQEKINNLNQKL